MFYMFLGTEHISWMYKDVIKIETEQKCLFVNILKSSADRWFVNLKARLLK